VLASILSFYLISAAAVACVSEVVSVHVIVPVVASLFLIELVLLLLLLFVCVCAMHSVHLPACVCWRVSAFMLVSDTQTPVAEHMF